MPRKRRGTIGETPQELRDILKHHHGKPSEPRIRMLIMMQEDPTCTIAHVAESLRYNERMIRRWWKEYQDEGLAKLLGANGNGVVRGVVAEARGQQYGNAQASLIPPNIEKFLNALPLIDKPATWITIFRDALRELLGDVDRIMINVNVHCDIHDPDSDGNADFFVIQHVREEKPGKRSSHVTTQPNPQTPGKMLIEDARRGGFPAQEYQPPHCFDYYLQKEAYLGTIVLWRSRSEPPISGRTLDAMESLRPFLIFLLSDCIGRQNREKNSANTFNDIVTRLGQEAGLTPRQLEVLLHYILGEEISEISKSLYRSTEAIRKHIKAIHQKMGVRSHKELMARYFTPLKDQ
jgi:DNA-binding CsgD family transcriptional regulator